MVVVGVEFGGSDPLGGSGRMAGLGREEAVETEGEEAERKCMGRMAGAES